MNKNSNIFIFDFFKVPTILSFLSHTVFSTQEVLLKGHINTVEKKKGKLKRKMNIVQAVVRRNPQGSSRNSNAPEDQGGWTGPWLSASAMPSALQPESLTGKRNMSTTLELAA